MNVTRVSSFEGRTMVACCVLRGEEGEMVDGGVGGREYGRDTGYTLCFFWWFLCGDW